MNVVWFKRDLRLSDHTALARAARQGPVLLLYILEPELWQQPDMSERQFRFLTACLDELKTVAQDRSIHYVIKVGEAVDVLTSLHQKYAITALWSHQETGNGWTFARDQRVARWCQHHHIPWHEPAQHGVVRRLANRSGWAARWYRQMKQPIAELPPVIHSIDEPSDSWPSPADLGWIYPEAAQIQSGGRSWALGLLHDFLHERGETYTRAMSSPVTAFDRCSRLSPHLAFGTVSIREVFQAVDARKQALMRQPATERGMWPSALRSFSGRLRWHCHFIQKLEDEPRIEFRNLHPAYDGLRESEFNPAFFEVWQAGRTGYPMVDACMRALKATGWLNFRMRAMVMSFASYHLWLHWRQPALYLAQMFTDYEPGIHYSQAQMQSGTTGINTLRIYNPIKQGIDHDPEGVFIRRWVPELMDLDRTWIHTPWLAPSPPTNYPKPIVDEVQARKVAAEKIYRLRKTDPMHREWAQKIAEKHASRKPGRQQSPKAKQLPKAEKPRIQLSLFED